MNPKSALVIIRKNEDATFWARVKPVTDDINIKRKLGHDTGALKTLAAAKQAARDYCSKHGMRVTKYQVNK